VNLGLRNAALFVVSIATFMMLPGCLGLINPVERDKPVVIVERDTVFVDQGDVDTVFVKNTVRDTVKVFIAGPSCEQDCLTRYKPGKCRDKCIKYCRKSRECNGGGDDDDDDLALEPKR
jgi:hypothetical protein